MNQLLTGLYILDGHKTRRATDMKEWGECFHDMSKRRVAKTKIGNIEISTVFLGMDHGIDRKKPMLFETMLFGDCKYQDECERYLTWDEAEEGHNRWISKVKELERSNTMKKGIVIMGLLLCLLMVGCGGIDTVSPEQPLGAEFDPCEAREWIRLGAAIGTTTTAAGVATGNPPIAGFGIVVAAIAGIAGTALVALKKKEQ